MGRRTERRGFFGRVGRRISERTRSTPSDVVTPPNVAVSASLTAQLAVAGGAMPVMWVMQRPSSVDVHLLPEYEPGEPPPPSYFDSMAGSGASSGFLSSRISVSSRRRPSSTRFPFFFGGGESANSNNNYLDVGEGPSGYYNTNWEPRPPPTPSPVPSQRSRLSFDRGSQLSLSRYSTIERNDRVSSFLSVTRRPSTQLLTPTPLDRHDTQQSNRSLELTVPAPVRTPTTPTMGTTHHASLDRQQTYMTYQTTQSEPVQRSITVSSASPSPSALGAVAATATAESLEGRGTGSGGRDVEMDVEESNGEITLRVPVTVNIVTDEDGGDGEEDGEPERRVRSDGEENV
ncbi:hypothetical protein HK102_004832 [Quaeritorhiza haematococci]|nr:hypothetical protein HK102_004832 [Quaeritorhiza haematococci]